jgi:hypothetical protein
LALEEVVMPESTSGIMETETASLSDSVSASGKDAFRAVEGGISTLGRGIWGVFHELPFHGALVGGAVGLGAAMLVGVAELVAAGFTAYVSYRMFAYGESLAEAIEKTIKFEKGTLPEEEIEKPVPE